MGLFSSSDEGEASTQLSPLETDPVSETLCFLVFGIVDDGQSPETQQF
jgi:hypothetical protein